MFTDVNAIEELDTNSDPAEERVILTGRADGRLLVVVYTRRDDRIRIISARGATHDMSKTSTTVRTRLKGGKWYRVGKDGRQRRLADRPADWSGFDAMTGDEITAAARSDPDNPPRQDYAPGRLKRVPKVKAMRRALGLTQEEFSARFRIPLGTLRDWEQGKTEPEQAARAYLTVIARKPEAVMEALAAAQVV